MHRLAYLSYSQPDEAFATALISAISSKKLGITVLDHKGLDIGQSFTDYIVSQIEHSEIIFFLISQNFLSSEWCIEEMKLASDLGKYMVPIAIGNCKVPLEYGHLRSVTVGRPDDLKIAVAEKLHIALENLDRMKSEASSS